MTAAAARARALADVGRLPEAEQALRTGLIETPADPELLALLAGVLRLQGRRSAALAAADAAVAAAPQLSGAHIERAECLLLLPPAPDPGIPPTPNPNGGRGFAADAEAGTESGSAVGAGSDGEPGLAAGAGSGGEPGLAASAGCGGESGLAVGAESDGEPGLAASAGSGGESGLVVGAGSGGEPGLAVGAGSGSRRGASAAGRRRRVRADRDRADEQRLAEALAEAEEAVRLAPAFPPAHRVLARTLVLRREFGRAREAARRALELAPGSVTDLLTLAEIERIAGRRGAARQAVQQALARDPENPDGRWLIALLDAERLRVGSAMRGLRGLAADHPGRLDVTAMTWPIRGLLAGLRRGLTVGVPVTAALVVTAFWWSGAVLLARASAGTVAVVLLLFGLRVLIPAGLLPWRCLTLLPPRTRRAILGGLVAAGATVTLLLGYAVTALWQLTALTLAAGLLVRRADPV
ncbi:hypothetical protein OHA21_03530 [Actinoplanes sp. NBC_00393]|uniref:tetratricopeptide repeat protein n=1 Tax=Actinoplanes sp. NBC_00393 TaxID=2975953 RepID=UPI002E1DD7CA